MINLLGYENVTPLHESSDLVLCRATRGYDDFPVLIKYPNSELPSPRLLSGLKNEFAAAQEIGNTGIIQAVTLHRTDNSLALILEDKGYQLLSNLIHNNRIGLAQKVSIALKIVKSIGRIHSKDFLHHNIRPDSIAVSQDFSEAVLTNLQYSSRISDSFFNNSGLIAEENLAYISPEQSGRINGEIDRRSDFYSYGVTLFELFTQQLPFKADDALELIHYHLAKEPPVPHHINPEIPTAVSEVIMKLLAKNPGDRYQSAHGIGQDLKACLHLLTGTSANDAFIPGEHDISDTFTLSGRLFGRKEEKEILLQAYERVSVGKCEVVLVRGEAGCGKTTLVRAISKQIFKDRGEFISGKFDQFKRNRPYSAIIQAFQELLRKRLASPAPVVTAWKKRIIDVLGKNAALIIEVIPELELLIGPQHSPPKLPSTEDRNRFDLTFKNFIKVFPSMDKPLVLFLDDLQWADQATVNFIKRLLEDRETSYLMLIGAYRASQHLEGSVLSMMADIDELSSKVETITLDKLKLRHVHGFISRTLRAERKRTEELTKLVYNRTGGNPLFVREYLRNLHRAELIVFNQEKTRWEWDLKAIRDISIDGNIVELMADKIMTQPLEGREILKTASCIGGKFDLRILLAVTELPKESVINYLNLALHEGLVVSDTDIPTVVVGLEFEQNSPTFLSFMHDRVQQAAYSMLTASEKNALHLKTGNAMLDIFSDNEVDDMIFEIASQFNFSINGLYTAPEHERVYNIFLRAGKKAKHSSAFELAAKYLSTASRLADPACWTKAYSTTFKMYLDWFESEFLSGSTKHSEDIFKTIIKHVDNRKDLATAHLSKIKLYSDRSRYHDAVKIGLDMLAEYNIRIPEKPGKAILAIELVKTRLALSRKSRQQLYNLPEMKDAAGLETMRILIYTITPAYMFNKNLVFFMVLKMIRMSVKYGNAPSSAFGYIFYALFLAAKEFAFDKSKEYAKLAVDLNRKFNNPELETKIDMLRGAMHDHWHIPLSQNISTLETALRTGLTNGDDTFARFSGYFAVYYRSLQGGSITEVKNSAKELFSFVRKNKNSLSTGLLNLVLQMCKSMEGHTYSPGYLDDDDFREAALVGMAKSSGSEVVEYWTGITKITTLTFFGYHAKTIGYIDSLYGRVDQALLGMYTVPIFHFLSIINYAAVFADSSKIDQKRYLRRIDSSLSKLQKWQEVCPDNFSHLYTLAKAEQLRLTGALNKAILQYEEAIRSCTKIGCNSFAALACELAAKLHFTIGGKRSGLSLLSEAMHYYRKWGANAKVQKLLREHNLLQNDSPILQQEEQENIQPSTKGNNSLDISAVVKASQAISGEIVLDRLLDKLMRIVIENAGAQKATLLLNNKNSLELTAHAFVSEHGTTTRVKPAEDQEVYCKSIVNYVLRSKDSIVLRDAGTQGPFTIDSYIIRTKPKSILAMPVVNQQIMRGVLYLENNLSPGVFTEERLEVLNLLCSQAAISIQNARLYSDLRDSETQHRTLLESINVGVFRAEADLDGRLLKCNRALADMFGYTSWNEFRRTPLRSLFVNPNLHRTILKDLSDGNIVRDREVNMTRKDGNHIWVNMTASLQHDGKENHGCLDGILEDVTEKRKARELERAKVAADAANKAKSDFLASMSHEIRTPMNAILGMADLLWESRLSKVQRNYVRIFKNAGENLLLLINDILDLSKIEAGQINFEAIDFNIVELFDEIGSIFSLRAQAKGLNFGWYISPDVPQIITGDPTRIRQIIVNLVGNAMKFTEEGTIAYEAGLTENGLLRVIIRDTGLGIPASKMNSIFDTFSQADSSTTRNFGGTGLGLSICTRMVASMDGGIFVSSEEGEGSSFAFTIRIGIPFQPVDELSLENMVVLLVDQPGISRDFLEASLKNLHAEVRAVANYSEAIAQGAEMSLSSSGNKALVVINPSDDEEGFETLKKLKREICKGWKLFMIMQAKTEPRATARARQLGANIMYLPVNPYSLAESFNSNQTESCELIESAELPCNEENMQEINNPTILLIEDSEDNQMVIDLFLSKTPYSIEYAINGKEGLEKFIAGSFDLILMDIQMPVMDGYEATRAIRKYEQENGLNETPILALTANAFQEDEEKCLECGCTAHMAKPIKKKKLLKTLEEYLRCVTD